MESTDHKVENQRTVQIPTVYWVVLILLLAAGLRIIGVYNISPPGLEHDEVANWLIDRAILGGSHAIYFTEAYGHEAGFHYLQAMLIGLLGDHALALRLPAVFAGLLLVAVHFALIRRLFGVPVSLISTAFLAVLFWPILYSRLGLRAILLPVVSGISLYCWWKAWQFKFSGIIDSGSIKPQQSATFWLAIAGLFAGLSMYTYMAARAVPIFYAIFLLYLFIFHRPTFKERWRGILLFLILFAVVAAPILIYLKMNPGSEFRITEIDAPMRALMAGDFRPVMQNSIKIVGMFGISGDPLWRQNVAGRPVFGPVLAILFYAGLLLALWRWKDVRYAFLLLWLGTSAIPSIVTVDAPSSIRMINALLVVTVFPAVLINKTTAFSTDSPRLSTKVAYLLVFLLIATHIWRSADAVFHSWPENEEVRFVWQEALTDTAAYLDKSQNSTPTAVGGWSPATFDPPTMLLSMRRRDLDMRYFGSDSTIVPVSTLIVPKPADGGGVRITRPSIRELAPGLEEQLRVWGGSPFDNDSFVLYDLSEPPQVDPQIPANDFFDESLEFLGYSFIGDSEGCSQENCRLLTYWQVIAPVDESVRFFLHAVGDAGEVFAQDDRLDAPSQYWQPGDIVVQEHLINLEKNLPEELNLGVYIPQTGRRLQLTNGADHVSLIIP